MGAVFFGLGFAVGYPVVINLEIAIGLITGSYPMCLMIQLTVCLMMGDRSLAKKKVLIKDIDSIEPLAAITTIVSDKTGTLTCNKMVASSVYYNGHHHKAENRQKWGAEHSYEYDIKDPGFKRLQ
jgi:sodium/potassium-transporting ATPase subunit alpha